MTVAQVIYSTSISLDGFIAGPGDDLGWVLIDEELHRYFNDESRDLAAFLYGRRMYELMAGYWPTADDDPSITAWEAEWARLWREKPKVVFSTTLEHVAWNSRLVRGDVAAEIARLKAQPGGDLGIGGAGLASEVIRLGLVDEYRLLVHPVVLGAGRLLFPALDAPAKLGLVETRTFGSGVVLLRYRTER
jgi:dihydrofolate reductase